MQGVPPFPTSASWARGWAADPWAWTASLCYLALAALWIALSDALGALLFESPQQLTRFQSYKGGAFVFATAALIFFLLRRPVAAPASAAVPARAGRVPISTRLVLLVLASTLPLLAIMGYGTYREASRDVVAAREQLARQAELASAQVRRLMLEHVRLGQLLARRPGVRSLEASSCDLALAGVAAVRDSVAEIATYSRAGGVVCPPAGALAQAPAPGIVGVLEAGAPVAVGAPMRVAAGGSWLLPVAVAIPGKDGGMAGVLQLLVRPSAFDDNLGTVVTRGGVNAVIDTRGNLITRIPAMPALLGRPVTGYQGARDILARGDGDLTATGADGVERLYAFRTSAEFGLVSITGMPADAVFAPARRNLLEFGLAALVVVALAAATALILGRRISGPMAALQEAAEQAAAGNLEMRAPETGSREMVRVAQVFNRMLDRIAAIQRVLRGSELRHRSLVEQAPDGIVVQQGGRVEYVNPRFRQMIGMGKNERDDSLDLVELALPEYREALTQRLTLLEQRPGESAPLALLLHRRDGTTVEVEHACSSVNLQGQLLVQSHLLDVSARNQAQRDLRKANEMLEERIRERTAELEAANQALESFSYSVAHDLRSPVSRVGGFAGALEQAVRRGDAGKAAHYAARIAHNARTMEAMIEGLLRLSRAGRVPLEPLPVDMAAMVRELLAELGPHARETVEVGALPVLPADAATMRQVWSNLLSNALKYSSRRERPQVRVQCRLEAGQALFSVSDNGEGFAPDEAAQLFGVFQRLGSGLAFEGTGVGLAIVKRIVERHGGRIWAEGRPGEGATFWFTLPSRQPG